MRVRFCHTIMWSRTATVTGLVSFINKLHDVESVDRVSERYDNEAAAAVDVCGLRTGSLTDSNPPTEHHSVNADWMRIRHYGINVEFWIVDSLSYLRTASIQLFHDLRLSPISQRSVWGDIVSYSPLTLRLDQARAVYRTKRRPMLALARRSWSK